MRPSPVLRSDKEADATSLAENQFDDDEPPVLSGDMHPPPTDSEGVSIMDQMIEEGRQAIAMKAVERSEIRRKESQVSFKQGLRRGFFHSNQNEQSRSAPDTNNRLEVKEQSSAILTNIAEGAVQRKRKQESTNSFCFPEVQEALQESVRNDTGGWMDAQFMDRISKEPKLLQALQNPKFMRAVQELQSNTKEAVRKYQNDPEIAEPLTEFIAFLGNHFEQLGNQQESQHVDTQQASNPSNSPKIIDVDQARREALQQMPTTHEEKIQVEKILKNQDLLDALSDQTFMQALRFSQKSSKSLAKIARDPIFGPKLQLLLQNNMDMMKAKVDAELAKYRQIQEECQKLATQRQQYAQQANENTMVQQELGLLDSEAKVYKLVGPVLLKHDITEAKANVEKRLEFIHRELEKVTKKMEEKEKEAVSIRSHIAELQLEMQKQAAQAAQQAVAAH